MFLVSGAAINFDQECPVENSGGQFSGRGKTENASCGKSGGAANMPMRIYQREASKASQALANQSQAFFVPETAVARERARRRAEGHYARSAAV